jgi:hypothetical protein
MEQKPHKKEPGQYVAMGIALGAGLGVALGTVFDNIALGIAIGMGVGITMGSAFEHQAKERGEVREFTPEEKAKEQRYAKFGLFVGIMLFVLTALLYLFVK